MKALVKHYFVFSAIQGALVGAACITIFGYVAGLLLAVVMAVWGVRAAKDMVRDDKASKEGQR